MTSNNNPASSAAANSAAVAAGAAANSTNANTTKVGRRSSKRQRDLRERDLLERERGGAISKSNSISGTTASLSTAAGSNAATAAITDNATTTSETTLVTLVRQELSKYDDCLDQQNHPTVSITSLLLCFNNDPVKVAQFLRRKSQPDRKRPTRSDNASTIAGRSLASNDKSIHDNLRKDSLPRPSANVVIFDVPEPKEDETFFPNDPGRNKMSMKQKADASWVARGKEHQSNWAKVDPTTGEVNSDEEQRFARCCSETKMEATMTRTEPDPNGSTNSARQGIYGLCQKCNQRFDCLASTSNEGAIQFANVKFESHKKHHCGKVRCACGYLQEQLEEYFKGKGSGSVTAKSNVAHLAKNHLSKCKQDEGEYIDSLNKWSATRDQILAAMEFPNDDAKAEKKEAWALPPQRGLANALKKATLGKEERAKLLKRWDVTRCSKVFNYFNNRKKTRLTSSRVKKAMKSAGVNVSEVEVIE